MVKMRNPLIRATTIFILSIFLANMSCHKILFMSPIGSPSHRLALDPLIKELASRGHQITFVSAYDRLQEYPNVINVAIPEIMPLIMSSGMSYFEGRSNDIRFLGKLFSLFHKAADLTFKLPLVADILENPLDSQGKPKFDLLVVDASLSEFTLPLAQRMSIPAVYINPSGLFSHHTWSLNIPHPFSYVPNMLAGVPVRMNFLDRLYNTAFNLVFLFMRNYDWLPRFDDVVRRSYPEARPIIELEREVSLLITNSHCSFQISIPSMPYFIQVGGMHLTPAKKLPKDLEDFMQSSPEGVVYFSLGSSVMQDSLIPKDMTDKLMVAFAKLKQNVIFKGGVSQDSVPSNVKVVQYVPQKDLLDHSRTKLFISHGGGLSMMEAAYHGCPLLAFPLTADHYGHMAFAKEKGFAEVLDWKTFTVEELSEKLDRMLNTKSYAENVATVSRIMRDTPQHPKELAAYWIEYVIRHKGAPHLKSDAEHLNIFQYFLLDVIGAVLLAAAIVFAILFLLLRAIYRSIFSKLKQNNKKIKKIN